MASSAVTHKLELDVEIKASPEQFHDMFMNKPHHVHHACSDKVQGCELHEGEWGKVGAILTWSYVHDGKAKKLKEVIDAVDPDKNSLTLRAIEGDLMEEYKSFVVTLQVSAKPEGHGSIVNWTCEYERLHDAIAHPETFMELAKDISKDIDAHLAQ